MSQNSRILKHLKSGGSLTAVTAANKFSCWRLAARINELRNQGHDIESTMIKSGNIRFSVYRFNA